MAKKTAVLNTVAGMEIPQGINVDAMPMLEAVLTAFLKNQVLTLASYRQDRDSKVMKISEMRMKPWAVAVSDIWGTTPDGKRVPTGEKTLTVYGIVAYRKGFDRNSGQVTYSEDSEKLVGVDIAMISDAQLCKEPARLRKDPQPGKVWLFPDCADNAKAGPRAELKAMAKKLIGFGWSDKFPTIILQ